VIVDTPTPKKGRWKEGLLQILFPFENMGKVKIKFNKNLIPLIKLSQFTFKIQKSTNPFMGGGG